MPIVTVEKPLKDKLGDEAVDALVRLINQSQGEQENNVVEFVGDKFERRLTEEIAQVNVNIFEVEKRFDHRLSEEIAQVNTNILEVEKRFDHRLTEKIAQVNTNIFEVEKRFDHRLSEEIAQVNVNIFEVEKRFDSRLSEEIAKVRVELAATRADLLKWMLIFSIGQVGVIVGLVLLFFK